MNPKVSTLLALRGEKSDTLTALATNAKGALVGDELTQFSSLKAEIESIDAQVAQIKEAQAFAAKSAVHVPGQEQPVVTVAAAVAAVAAKEDKAATVGALMRMIGASKGNIQLGLENAKQVYGERAPVTEVMAKALATNVGSAGGFLVPEDYVSEVIELLRPATVVRRAGPRILPMPNGTLRIPKQTAGAVATYGAESAVISATQQAYGNVIPVFKKLTALVPISNDMMRYANPAIDGLVRDDLVKQTAVAEDKSFLRGDGTQDTPRGFRSFSPVSQIVLSNPNFTLATSVGELGLAVLALKNANVQMVKPSWFMAPRTEEYLLTVQNSNGFFVFRDEMLKGNLRGYPFYVSTNIPTNLTVSGTPNCSELYLADMDSVMICDALVIRLDVSQDGSYIDAQGVQRNAFQLDQTLIRAIIENDLQMRHDEAVTYINGLAWAPTG